MWKKSEPFEEKEMVVEGTQVIAENDGNKPLKPLCYS